MTEKSKIRLTYAIVALFFFLAGMFFAPNGNFVRKVHKKLSYTKGIAGRLYNGWEKENLFFQDGTSLKDFEDVNKTYIIYFWATWCPHCNNIHEEMNSLKNSVIPLIALPFDTSKEDYDAYCAENPCFWQDLFQKNGEGEFIFCPRENSYEIPSIPSLWIIKNSKIEKIYIGEKSIRKFFKKEICHF